MTNITFVVPDEKLQDFIDGTSHYYGYSATLPDGTANPETKAQFGKRKTAANMRRIAIKGLKQIQEEALDEPDIDVEPT